VLVLVQVLLTGLMLPMVAACTVLSMTTVPESPIEIPQVRRLCLRHARVRGGDHGIDHHQNSLRFLYDSTFL
jgi:hypothetical protein